MTAAGVQSIDSTAYLPPPPSTSSTPDSKGTGAAGKQATDSQAPGTQGDPSDFQSELALQQTGTQETNSAAPTKTGSEKTTPGKSDKKRNTQPDTNASAVTPAPVVEPQKQILPVVLAIPQVNQPVDNNPATDVKSDEETLQDTSSQSGQAPQSIAPKQSAKLRQPVPPVQTPPKIAASTAAPAAPRDSSPNSGHDSKDIQALPLAPVPSVVQDVPVRPEAIKPEDSSSDQPPAQSVKLTQPVSQADLKLPAAPAEPAASAIPSAIPSGMPGTLDSAPSSPSALAFAARISAAQQKADQPTAVDPVQSLAVSGSQTSTQIPVRYAATAQIIQAAVGTRAVKTQDDEAKKEADDFSDKFARPNARTDMVQPRFEASSEPVPSSGAAAPQQSAPVARPEAIVEPPAAPPTSSHDIRVQVPDNKGGSTQVRFVESGGEVRVSVRTADEGLAQNLRTHLNDLTQRLSDGGMPAEIFKPAANASSSQSDQHQAQQDGRGSGGRGSGGQGGQQDRQQKRPAWLDEMEASLHGESN